MLELSNLGYYEEYKVMTTVPLLNKIVDVFKNFEQAQHLTPVDWLSSEFIHIHKYTCDNSMVIFEGFEIRWPKTDYQRYLSEQFESTVFYAEQQIQRIEDILGITDHSFSVYEEYYYFDLDGNFKTLREYSFQDAYDENADGFTLLIYEDVDFKKIEEAIEDFYRDEVTRYMKLPPELNKKISELTDDEIELLKMYII